MASIYQLRQELVVLTGYDNNLKDVVRRWDAQEATLDDIINSLENLRELFQERSENFYYERVSLMNGLSLEALMQDAVVQDKVKNILSTNYLGAMGTHTEFAEYPLFKKTLDKFFLNPKMSLFSVSAVGNQVVVQIHAEEQVGTPEELGSAITAARETMKEWSQENMSASAKNAGFGGKEVDGETATMIWFIKLYGPARLGTTYWRWRKPKGSKRNDGQEKIKVEYKQLTSKYIQFYKAYMKARIEEMAPKAPLWYLLENGNMNVKLTSDKGGHGKPEWEPTYFIQNSETQIARYLELALSERRSSEEPVGNNFVEEARNQERVYDGLAENCADLIGMAERLKDEGADLGYLDKEYKFFFREMGDFVDDVNVGEKTLDKIQVKQVIAIRRAVLGEIPEGERMYIVGKDKVEKRMTAQQILKQAEQDPLGQQILKEVQNLPRDMQKSLLEIDQIRWKNLLIEEKRKRKY